MTISLVNRPFPGRVFFDHLPKTAGTAVSTWLREVLGRGCVTPTHLWGNHQDLIQQYGGQYSLISAHAHFNHGEGLDPRYQYVTLFRDPIERVFSWLYFIVNNHDQNDPLLADTIEKVRRFLDSDGQEISSDLLPQISNIYVGHFSRIEGIETKCDDEKVKKALAAIRQYDVVGIYSDMTGFLADVAALIGLCPPNSIAVVHATKHRPKVGEVSPALRSCIADLNKLDLQLYEEVVSRKAASGADHKEPLSGTQSRWKKYEPVQNRVVTTPDLSILDAGLKGVNVIAQGQLVAFDVNISLARPVRDLEMGIHIFDNFRRVAFRTSSAILAQPRQSLPSGSFRVSYHLGAILPAGKYSAGFFFSERRPEVHQELAWYDVLCEFEVHHPVSQPIVGYANLPAAISVYPTWLPSQINTATQWTGSLMVRTPVPPLKPGAQAKVSVEVINRSEQVWEGDSVRPLNLSYHWLKPSGEILVFDGLRTPLTTDGIQPGRSLSAEMLVEAPSGEGRHVLVLTVVQEYVAWFEELGFEAARLEVDVKLIHE